MLDEAKSREQLIQELSALRSQLTAQEQGAGRFYRQTLDALPANIAVLGGQGKIVFVNKAWREFSEQNGTSAELVSEGRNYLQVCDEASGEYSTEAKPFAKGIRMVLSGKKTSYAKEYPCHSPEKKRWFLGNVAPFSDGACHAIVIHVNITELKQARHALQKAAITLEERVAARTALAQARTRQLQKLSAELIEAEERERRRFAELLHDDLQQILAAARMQLEQLGKDLTDQPTLSYVEQLLEESIGKSRSLAYELSPPVLHHSDLVTALQWLVRRTQDQYGLHVQLHTDPPQHFESVPLKVFVFRAVQELLCNIAKHAGVRSAEVVLSSREGMAIVTVSDKGGGFDPSILDSLNNRSGFGLLSLRERANYMGGHLVVKSAPGRGSRFTFTLPLSGSIHNGGRSSTRPALGT